MYTQFEEKGKIFTQVVSKKAIPVIIQTITNQIHGTMHIRPEERIKDELDQSPAFIALTEVEVMDASGATCLYQSKFLAIQVNQIVWVLPEEELVQGENE